MEYVLIFLFDISWNLDSTIFVFTAELLLLMCDTIKRDEAWWQLQQAFPTSLIQ